MTDHKNVLLELEKKLQTKLDKIHVDFAAPANADSSERAMERENDEVLNQLEHQVAQELQQVRDVLQAVASGRYGFCCAVSVVKPFQTSV